jgi:hypothetical protein
MKTAPRANKPRRNKAKDLFEKGLVVVNMREDPSTSFVSFVLEK